MCERKSVAGEKKTKVFFSVIFWTIAWNFVGGILEQWTNELVHFTASQNTFGWRIINIFMHIYNTHFTSSGHHLLAHETHSATGQHNQHPRIRLACHAHIFSCGKILQLRHWCELSLTSVSEFVSADDGWKFDDFDHDTELDEHRTSSDSNLTSSNWSLMSDTVLASLQAQYHTHAVPNSQQRMQEEQIRGGAKSKAKLGYIILRSKA